MTSSGAIADCRKALTRAWNHISFFQTYFQSSLLLLLYWYNWKWAFTHNGRPNTHSACLPDQKHLTNGDQIFVTSRSDAFQIKSGKPRLVSVHLSDFIQTMNVSFKIIQFLLTPCLLSSVFDSFLINPNTWCCRYPSDRYGRVNRAFVIMMCGCLLPVSHTVSADSLFSKASCWKSSNRAIYHSGPPDPSDPVSDYFKTPNNKLVWLLNSQLNLLPHARAPDQDLLTTLLKKRVGKFFHTRGGIISEGIVLN